MTEIDFLRGSDSHNLVPKITRVCEIILMRSKVRMFLVLVQNAVIESTTNGGGLESIVIFRIIGNIMRSSAVIPRWLH